MIKIVYDNIEIQAQKQALFMDIKNFSTINDRKKAARKLPDLGRYLAMVAIDMLEGIKPICANMPREDHITAINMMFLQFNNPKPDLGFKLALYGAILEYERVILS